MACGRAAHFHVEDRRRPDRFEPRLVVETPEPKHGRFVQRLGFDLDAVPDAAGVFVADAARANIHGASGYHAFRRMFASGMTCTGAGRTRDRVALARRVETATGRSSTCVTKFARAHGPEERAVKSVVA